MVYQNGKAIAMSLTSSDEFSQEIYSTEEQVIGRWIDGRPLYGRVVENVTGLADGTNKVILEPHEDWQVVFYKGFLGFYDEFIQEIPSVGVEGETAGKYCYIHWNPTIGLRVRTNFLTWANKPIHVFLKYTKTTDSVSASSDKTMSVSVPEAVSVPASSAKTVDEI